MNPIKLPVVNFRKIADKLRNNNFIITYELKGFTIDFIHITTFSSGVIELNEFGTYLYPDKDYRQEMVDTILELCQEEL